MQRYITIDQAEALTHGLNLQQAVLLGFIQDAARWAESVTQGGRQYRAISKKHITQALPLLTEKEDTAYRLLKVLEHKGLIELSHNEFSTLVRLIETGGGCHVR